MAKEMINIFIYRDGNGAEWVGFRPAPLRSDPFRDPPQKNLFTACPVCFNGYPFNPTRRVPDPIQIYKKKKKKI
jgi:hypothetical protein